MNDPKKNVQDTWARWKLEHLRIDDILTPATIYTGCDTVTDNFNRADAGDGTLGMASDGTHRWLNVSTASGGVWTTGGAHGNSAQCSSSGGSGFNECDAILNAHGNSQDLTFTAHLDSGSATDEIWAILRSSADFGYFYSVAITRDNTTSGIYKKIPGQPAVFLSPLPTVTDGVDITVRAEIRDEAINVWFDGSLVRTIHVVPEHDESAWTYLGIAMGRAGSGAVGTNTYVDDLSAVAATNATVPSGWGNLALLNSFTDGGGGSWPSPQYLKDSAGVVHLRGIVNTTGVVSTTMFTLPPGYRPSMNQAYVLAGDSGPNNVDGFVTVQSSGNAVIQPPMPTTNVELSGIFFYAEA